MAAHTCDAESAVYRCKGYRGSTMAQLHHWLHCRKIYSHKHCCVQTPADTSDAGSLHLTSCIASGVVSTQIRLQHEAWSQVYALFTLGGTGAAAVVAALAVTAGGCCVGMH